MELSQETLKTIGSYVKGNLAEWMREVGPPVPSTDPQLLERIVRVEESLEHQRELMERGFEQVDKRFQQVDKRFEELRSDFLSRFEEQRAQGRRLFGVLTTILGILTLLVGYGTFLG